MRGVGISLVWVELLRFDDDVDVMSRISLLGVDRHVIQGSSDKVAEKVVVASILCNAF